MCCEAASACENGLAADSDRCCYRVSVGFSEVVEKEMSKATTRRYRRALVCAAVFITSVVLFTLFECFFYYYGARNPNLFRRESPASLVRLEGAQEFVGSEGFDAYLGWDSRPAARNYRQEKDYWGLSFGDSFTFGEEVDDQHTWQSQFEEITRRKILNFGVDGYGIDQAILKAEKYVPKYSATVIILGVNAETYRRALSYHLFYYFANREDWLYAFKPIFVRVRNGYELVEPPCGDANCLIDLLTKTPQRLDQLMKTHDYWYQDYLHEPQLSFPYSISVIKAFPRWLERRQERSGRRDYYFVNEFAFDLTKYVIRRFADFCERMNKKPLILFLNGPSELQFIRGTGQRWDQPLLAYLQATNIAFVDSTQFILDRWHNDAKKLAAPNWHFNATGNRLIAEALVEYLGQKCDDEPAFCL